MTTTLEHLLADASAEASVTTPAPALPRAQAAPREEAAPRARAFWRALGTGISAGLLALVLALAVVAIVIPKATHSTTLTVRTGSMRPHLPPGTLLVVRPEPTKDIKVGDVVTYEPNPNDATTVISHRVIAIGTSTTGGEVFTVKGDANNTPDAPVQPKQIVAVLWYSIPLLGWVNAWVNTAGRGWLTPAVAGALFLYAAYSFTTGFIEYRRRRREPRKRHRAASE